MGRKIVYSLLFLLLFGVIGLYNFSARSLWHNQDYDGAFNESHPLKVMTFNIRGGRDDGRHVQLDQIIKEIKTNDPDVIGLQEVDIRLPRSNYLNEIEEISHQLNMSYVFVPTINFVIGAYGDAILSKYPIQSYDRYRLPGGLEPRGLIKAAIEYQGQLISIYSTHLGLSEKERQKQFKSMEAIVKSDHEPKIVLGDLNTKPKEFSQQNIQKYFTDSTSKEGKTFITLPSEKTQIDYVLYTRDFRPLEQYAGKSFISDHNPLLCTLLVQK